jgi:hypothetical protein
VRRVTAERPPGRDGERPEETMAAAIGLFRGDGPGGDTQVATEAPRGAPADGRRREQVSERPRARPGRQEALF